jgi:predicted GIY-YIG superfamily endonuclease
MFWYVYIAKAVTGYYYTGITTDPVRRLIKHNSGHGSQMAKQQGPFTILYISKAPTSKSEARKREIQIKGWSRLKKERLIKGEWS